MTSSLQSVPHAMPAGLLATVPAPLPLLVTVSVTGVSVNVARDRRERASR